MGAGLSGGRRRGAGTARPPQASRALRVPAGPAVSALDPRVPAGPGQGETAGRAGPCRLVRPPPPRPGGGYPAAAAGVGLTGSRLAAEDARRGRSPRLSARRASDRSCPAAPVGSSVLDRITQPQGSPHEPSDRPLRRRPAHEVRRPAVLDRRRGRGGAPGRQAHGRGEERGQVVASGQGGVDADPRPAGLVRLRERPAGCHRLRAHGGPEPDDRTKIAADAERLPTVAGVVGKVVGPIFSPDGQAAQLVATIDLGRNGWQKAPETVQKLRDIASSGPSAPAVYVTGPAGGAADSADAFAGIDSKLLFSTLAVVIVILLLTYRSPALWLLPVISAGVALMVAE